MPLLEVTGASKAYPGVQALAGVDLAIDSGEVHALVGENGAGKSTLMKLIAGSVAPDEGLVELDGQAVPAGSPEAARRRGIGIVYQELSLVPQRSVAENVLMGRWPRRWSTFVDWSRLREEASGHLARVGIEAHGDRPVAELGIAERQLVELAKALSTDVRVLLLDEPTSALSEREAGRLFAIIRELRADGVAVLYVSHRLAELVAISDRVTVMRDGHVVDTVAAGDTDERQLAHKMVGHATTLIGDAPVERREAAGGTRPVALRARGLARPPRLRPVDLELREGEIVTVFGLVGAGRTRLARTLFGLEPASEGTLEVLGAERRVRTPGEAIAAGMGYVGEDRQTSLVPKLSVAANITLASLDGVCHGPLVDFEDERQVARRFVDQLSIRTASLDAPVVTLSGGNQQKVVLARWSCSGARVLVLDDPTRGIDVGAKEEVFGLVRALADDGAAVLYLTSEIREARALGDRLLVMADGAVVAELDPSTPERDVIAAAGGAHEA